jgi:putative spermidine/putrescine transport system permease protein
VSGTRAATLPKQMWDGIRTEIDPTVAAVSTLLIGVTSLALALLAFVRRRPRLES